MDETSIKKIEEILEQCRMIREEAKLVRERISLLGKRYMDSLGKLENDIDKIILKYK